MLISRWKSWTQNLTREAEVEAVYDILDHAIGEIGMATSALQILDLQTSMSYFIQNWLFHFFMLQHLIYISTKWNAICICFLTLQNVSLETNKTFSLEPSSSFFNWCSWTEPKTSDVAPSTVGDAFDICGGSAEKRNYRVKPKQE